jgi:hypothetical protein
MTNAKRSYVTQRYYHLRSRNTVFEDTITENQTLFHTVVTYVSNQVQKLGMTTASGGHAVAQLVEALRYKSEGRGFDSRWRHWNFSLT